MENGFDFGALLKNNENKHKNKPTQFISVAGGVQKRLQSNIKNRKSTRLTAFDNARNLERCQSPAPPPVSEAQLKMEHRRQQLEKYKLEKEQKKKEEAAQKKKPFLAGVPRNPLNLMLPPPLPKPTTSGRVTRSQTRNTVPKVPKQKTKSPVKPAAKGRNTPSFAPENASFKPPEIKNLAKLPKLAPVSKRKTRKTAIIAFEPVLPNAPITAKQTRSIPNLTKQNGTETMFNTRQRPETRTTIRGKVTKKPSPKRAAKKPLTSSSSGSDIESAKIIHRVQTPGPMKALNEPKELSAKFLSLESTSSEQSSGECGERTSRRKSVKKSVASAKDSQSSDNMTSDIDPSSAEERSVIKVNNNSRKSMLKNFSTSAVTIDTSAENISSDANSDQEMSPVVVMKRHLPCTPRNKGVPKSESSSEEKLRPPKSPVEMPLTPEQMESAKISPCVTFSRGKENARREMKWKIDEGLLDDDVSDMDSVDHFRKQLSSEIKRMTEMCDTWDKILAQTVLPETVQEAVLSAVGQARLLMSQKLQQFASLVERCAKPEPGTALVTPADLHGFWDMVYMQIENVDLRFKKLEELRSRDWSEDVAEVSEHVAGKKVNKQPARAARPKATSRLREMIAAARKAKKQLGEPCSSSADSSLSPASASASASESTPAPPAEGEKTFEAGFFCVRSPVRSPSSRAKPSPATPAGRSTLLKAVLSSEAKKASNSKKCTPFAMLRASLIGKSVECEGFAPLSNTPQMTPLNLFATPGRSILKLNVTSTTNSGKKSIKVVLFDDSDDSDPQSQSCMRDSNQSTISGVKTIENPGATLVQDKENSPVIELSSSRTRSQRKSLQNLSNIEDTSVTEKTTRRSSRKKNAEVTEVKKKTPSKQSARKKATKDTDLSVGIVEERKRSSGNKSLEISALEDVIPTPKRSSRRNKGPVC